MPIVALVGNKGGAGKTTLAVNLASGLARVAGTVIVDADPQRSSLQWRAIGGHGDGVAVIDAVADPVGGVSDAAARYHYVVIDCPPSVAARQTRDVLKLADLALIPVQPSPLDLWATVHIEAAVEAARARNPRLQAALVINQLEPRTRLSRIMRQGLAELELPALATAIRRRVAYRTSILEGRSVFDIGRRGHDAGAEILQLIREVIIP